MAMASSVPGSVSRMIFLDAALAGAASTFDTIIRKRTGA
jgi:hypothetical protein